MPPPAILSYTNKFVATNLFVIIHLTYIIVALLVYAHPAYICIKFKSDINIRLITNSYISGYFTPVSDKLSGTTLVKISSLINKNLEGINYDRIK